MPAAAQLFALERKVEMAFAITLVRIAVRNPMAAVPDHDGAAAVLSLRNGPFESVVFDGVILGVHGKALLSGNETWALGHGPALHHAVELEPEIIMQASCRMLLDDEPVSLATRRVSARLRRHLEFPLPAIDLKSHRGVPTSSGENGAPHKRMITPCGSIRSLTLGATLASSRERPCPQRRGFRGWVYH